MKNPVSVRQALQYVADYPQPLNDEVLQMPVHELVARTLFDIANNPDASVRGSQARANKARGIILDRLTGKRKAGTKPVSGTQAAIKFLDLTGGEPDEQEQPEQVDAAEAG